MRQRLVILAYFIVVGMTVHAENDTVAMIAVKSAEQEMYHRTGQEYMAVRRSRELVRLNKEYYGENDKRYIMSLLSLSELYAERLYPNTSNKYHRMAYEPYMHNIRKQFAEIVESEKSVYWKSVSDYFGKTVNIVYEQASKGRYDDGGEMAAAAYNALLLSKGLLLNLNTDFENFVMTSGDQKAIELLQKRKKASAQADGALMDSIDYAILDELRQSGNPYTVSRLSVTWQDVRDRLEREDIAIEFFKTENGDYGALMLRKSWKTPKVVRLADGKRRKFWSGKQSMLFNIEDVAGKVVRMYSDAEKSAMGNEFIDATNQMSKIVWCNALLQYLPYKSKGKVYFSADGILQLCPVEYLPIYNISGKDTLFQTISDVFDMRRVSSTRDLVLRKSEESVDSAVVYGGISYDVKLKDLIAWNKKSADVSVHVARNLDYQQIKRSSIPYLGGTSEEAKTIYSILRENNVKARMISSGKASEESFKRLNGEGYNILHIGTHGFYWNDYESDDALNKSGLFMAGANIVMMGGYKKIPEWMQDGILTAKEISDMNLKNCDIVILSACETARGDLSTDGVFGLQRAFKMAGVQTIVMSLWPVSDDATKMLMTEFYTNWIVKGEEKHEAFRNACLSVRFAKDDSGVRIFENPFFWAGFILLD